METFEQDGSAAVMARKGVKIVIIIIIIIIIIMLKKV